MVSNRDFIRTLTVLALSLLCVSGWAQADRKDVRAGNRLFRKGAFQAAEISYRKALVKDSTSFAATYNLANSLYREENFEEAGKVLESAGQVAPMMPNSSDYYFNLGDIACQKKDWKGAVEAFRQSLLRNPGDLEAKENYAYAKLMLENEEGGDGGDDDQDRDQNQDQNQDRNQNQNQDQDQNQDQRSQDQDQRNQQGQGDQGEARISPQQAQQMLNAMQAREKETQEKVNKEKALLLKSKQKEKNW